MDTLQGARRPGRLALACGATAALLAAASNAQTIRTHEGGDRNNQLGRSVAFVGDVDGDGRDDYAITGIDEALAPNPPFLTIRSGADGSVLTPLGVLSGPGPRTHVRAVGDVDADGVPDVAVHSNQSVGVLSVATDAYVWQRQLTINSSTATTAFAVIGDLDGDGVPEVAGTSESSFLNGGFTEVLSGADGSTLWSVPITGTSVSDTGDANGDGVDDVVVGDRLYLAAGVAAQLGRALVLDGTNGDVIRIHRADPIAHGQLYGAAVCRLQDVDGDGVDDFAVAAPATNRSLSYPSWVDIWSSATGERIRRMTRFEDLGLGGSFGSMIGAGDLDGDGRGDLFVGMVSDVFSDARVEHVYAYSGGSGQILAIFRSTGGPGEALAFGGDVDGDGSPDLIYGAPRYSGTVQFDDQHQGRVVVTRVPVFPDGVVRFCPAAPNVTGAPGRIEWTGSTSLAQASFGLRATDVPPDTFGLFVMHRGVSRQVQVGNGVLCIEGAQRLAPILATGAGDVSLTLSLQDLTWQLFDPLKVGDLRVFQFWSRDPIGAGSNLTDAVLVGFVP